MIFRIASTAAVALALHATSGIAADVPVDGHRLRIRDQRSMRDGVPSVRRALDVIAADAAIHAPAPGDSLDPSLAGASLFVVDASGGETARIDLPPLGWTRSGASWRYRKKVRSGQGTSVVGAELAPSRLRVRVRDKGGSVLRYTLDESAQGGLATVFELGAGIERYCTEFSGAHVRVDTGSSDAGCNVAGSFIAELAPRPAECANFTTAPVARDVCGAYQLFDFLVEGQMAATGIPGVAVAAIRAGEVLWTGAYGQRHVAPSRPALATTPFMLASISKVVTATAVLQLIEDGVFGLDDDIDTILDFPVDNPRVPGDEVITVRHLLTHTSGLADDETVWGGNPGDADSLYVLGDSPISLRDFMVGYFTPGGEWYDSVRNFTADTPGTSYLYSNLGTALLGYLVEAATGTTLDDHCENEIFAPLAMSDTGWHLSDFAAGDVAMPYESVGGQFYEWGHYGYPDFPNGQLRSSAADLARFLAAWASGGILDGTRILDSTTVEQALSVQYPGVDGAQGLSWYYDAVGPRTVIGHNGGDYGASTDMYFDPATGHGALVLLNTDADAPRVRASSRILEALFAIAETP